MNSPEQSLRSVHTNNFPPILHQLGISLVLSTYQAGKLIVLRADGNVINTHFRAFNKPMGLAGDREKLAIGSTFQIWELRNVPAVAPKITPPGKYDACYLLRRTHITGDIDIHEMAYAGNELWFVNTRFSCLCTLEESCSFVPRWRPPFVSAYSLEDRCHLNGLCIVNNQPKYVTAFGETDTYEGWRKNKSSGGIIMDVQTNEIVCRGLAMPHSPRWYDNRLWVLESGKGSLGIVDLKTKTAKTIAQLPGFTRGLAFWGRLAFIGLSQVRETAVFSGIPITEGKKERMCGVWVVNIDTGETIAFLRFEEAVQEIFAVQILPDIRFPEIIDWDEMLLGTSYVLPDEALREVVLPQETGNKPELYFSEGNNAYHQGRLEDAVNNYQRCLELKLDFTEARYNLAVCYRDLERWDDAEYSLQQVLKEQPDNADVYNNLGIIYQNRHQVQQAIAYYEQAIKLRFDFPDAHFNLGMSLLQIGELPRGWAECEWRWQTKEFVPMECPHPQWDGSDISDKVILVHTEQGAGDAIQFIRFIPLLAQRCKGIVFICIPELIPLFRLVPGITKILNPGHISLSEFQVYSPLMSLPHFLGTNLATIPNEVPYLMVDPTRNRLIASNSDRRKVGIVWGGSPTHKNDHNRSCKLQDLIPILEVPGLQFYSLQKGERQVELMDLPPHIKIENLSPYINDYGDTGRLIQQLDLIISVDTSVAHLAGALGKQVWVLLADRCDWRWMLERLDTPWYPTMRLFRQSQPKDWRSVVTAIVKELGG